VQLGGIRLQQAERSGCWRFAVGKAQPHRPSESCTVSWFRDRHSTWPCRLRSGLQNGVLHDVVLSFRTTLLQRRWTPRRT
jgi:hypothetical protein